ncbi:MAG: hypothetical protein MK137_03180 [Rickettsiales bacterium]|nr:hypothetical protein [Rickettsiales bacterium]
MPKDSKSMENALTKEDLDIGRSIASAMGWREHYHRSFNNSREFEQYRIAKDLLLGGVPKKNQFKKLLHRKTHLGHLDDYIPHSSSKHMEKKSHSKDAPKHSR